jgi:ribonuclease Z
LKFELLILGTGSATPILERHPSAQILTVDNEYFLIDCGEGTQYRLLEQKIKHSRIRHIFISHLHGDHYLGLIGLLSSMNLNQRTEDMTIYGPNGLDEILTTQFKHSDTQLRFKLTFVATDTTAVNQILDHYAISVETIPLQHRIPCCGFLFREKNPQRKLRKDLLPDDFPIPYIKMLKGGIDVVDEFSGKTYLSAEYATDPVAPRSYAYCSDTAYLESNVPQLKAVDLLYHEATFSNEHKKRATETNHSTAEQAAQIARKAKVQKLIIGHFSSRYKILDVLETEATAVFANSHLAEEGKTYQI